MLPLLTTIITKHTGKFPGIFIVNGSLRCLDFLKHQLCACFDLEPKITVPLYFIHTKYYTRHEHMEKNMVL